MMFANKFVVAIKHNGKVLREHGDLVRLPFGSEFSVLVKNLNSRRAKFSINIDGTDVLDGTEIIVNANSDVEIKRFIRNGNMNEGNAFKFIERTKSIEDGPRGIKVDDGIIRVEFWFEQEKPIITKTIHEEIVYTRTEPYPWITRTYRLYEPYFGSTTVNKSAWSGITASQGGTINQVFTNNVIASNASDSTLNSTIAQSQSVTEPINDIGITVPGSKVEQKFTTIFGFNAEAASHVIILKLTGMVGKVEIVKPITVQMKQKCTTCSKINKASSRFCSGCGTALTLL